MAPFANTQVSRRELLKQSTILSALGVAAAVGPLAVAAPPHGATGMAPAGFPPLTGLETNNLYSAIGVRPIVNAHGTYTVITGSRSLPEVKRAMYEASFYFVQLDELMAAVGREIAQLTGAPSAIVTTGCEAAIALATLACTTGANIEQCQALPYVRKKTKVIIPTHSRNPYDFGVRMTGAEIVEVDSPESLREELTSQAAMIYILSGPDAAQGPMSIANICAIAREHDVPVFVDAAAEEPVTPNLHLKAGASLVGYSGGKCMRGPQAAGLLIGEKSLTDAAWFQASPHHNYGRAYKVGKEEIMGMLAATRHWYNRDHEAEQREWQSWLDTIAARVKPLPTVTTEILHPEDLSNNSPRLRIHWDASTLKITGTELLAKLDAGTPRIMVDGATGTRPDTMASTLTVMPYMMNAGEETIVADAIYAGLSKPGVYTDPVVQQGAPAQVDGGWLVTIDYARGTGEQHFRLTQSGNSISGMQHGEIYTAPLTGSVHGNEVKLHSVMPVSGHTITWNFTGMVNEGALVGKADMGEYGAVSFKAVRA